MLKHILLLALTLLLSAQANSRILNERIYHFHSDILINEDCSVLIKESITVYAMGNKIQRGIYRDLPLSYSYQGGNVHVDFELLGLTRDGEPESYHTEWLRNGIRIYAGSEDVYLPEGEYTYEITYKVNHVLGFFEDRDELYWNINGNGWGFSIDSITANVYYPENAELMAYIAYTGAFGEDGSDYTAHEIDGGVHFATNRVFGPEQNMTISIGWDKGHLTYPTGWEEFLYWVKTYIVWIIGILGILLGFLFNFRTWYKYGRDPKPGTIIPLFYPPNGMSPAECAYLNNQGRKTKTMFGAQLMNLAIKGYLKIDADDQGKSTTYVIQRDDKREKAELNRVESTFLNKLMGSKDQLTIKKGTYNSRVKSAHDSLISDIDSYQKGKYYVRNAHLKGRQFIFPLLTAIAGGIMIWFYGGLIPVLVVAVILQIAMNVVFARLYEQPTPEGRKVMDDIAGFVMYMKYADKERIRMTNPPTMNFHHFEENLAYAIALGVAEEWAGQFDPVEIEEFRSGHMPYYHGLVIASFADFSSNLSSTISSAAVPPASSGSSSGGGGFSGGGGGGGGGGGW